MGIRESVKQLLRMCGHAAVSTVHERLNVIEAELQDGLKTHTALLQSNIHLVQAAPALRSEIREAVSTVRDQLNVIEAEFRDGLNTHTALLQTSIHLVQAVPALHSEIRDGNALLAEEIRTNCAQRSEVQAIRDGLQDLKQHLQRLETKFGAVHASVEHLAAQTNDFLAHQAVRQVSIETSDYASANPELGLMAFLYSYLPTRKAIDIGANIGEVSDYLLRTGYEVYAFEPYPQSYTRLTDRLKGRPEFHSFPMAISSTSGEASLHLVADLTPDRTYDDPSIFHSLAVHGLPQGLSYQDTIRVPVQTLASLHREGAVPPDVSLVKIDTEGHDLEVIRGMKDHRYPVVSVEFWDAQLWFAEGSLYRLDDMVREMHQRGYLWFIVIYQIVGQDSHAFFCNHDVSVPGSWGNVFFFRDRDTFAQAQQWCTAVLPRTHFKAVPTTRTAHNAVDL